MTFAEGSPVFIASGFGSGSAASPGIRSYQLARPTAPPKSTGTIVRPVFLNSSISLPTKTDAAPRSVPTRTNSVQFLIVRRSEAGKSLPGSVPSLSMKQENFFCVSPSARPAA